MDGEQIAERILDYLERIGQTLADLAPDAKRIAIQSVYADIVRQISAVCILVFLAVVFLYLGNRLRKFGHIKQKTQVSYNDEQGEFEVFIGWLSIFVSIVLGTLSFIPVSNIVERLVAPEYHALLNMVNLITGN